MGTFVKTKTTNMSLIIHHYLPFLLLFMLVLAVVKSFLGNVIVITGSPGSGKTSTLSVILEVADNLHLRTELCAPTGRAAKRMRETTGKDAFTIHKLLEYGRSDDFLFGYNKKNKLDIDLLIVDEISMVDVIVMSSLLDALPTNCRLVLVGDDNQLQSVSAGNVLFDIIEAGKITIVELVHIFRQNPDALLVDNAQKIKAGHVRNNINPLKKGISQFGRYPQTHLSQFLQC
mgnify:CR=1 FL=1